MIFTFLSLNARGHTEAANEIIVATKESQYEKVRELCAEAYLKNDSKTFKAVFKARVGWHNVDDFGLGFGRFGTGVDSQKRLLETLEARKVAAALRRHEHDEVRRIAQEALRQKNVRVFEVIFTYPGWQMLDELGDEFKRFGHDEAGWDALFHELHANEKTHENYLRYKDHLMAARNAIAQDTDHHHFQSLNELAQHALVAKNKKFFEIVFAHPDHHNVHDLGKGFEGYSDGLAGLDELFFTLDPDRPLVD